jgi:hypothetical protein
MALLRLTDARPDAEINKLLKETIADAEVEWRPLKYEGQYPTTGFGITELRPKVLKGGTTDNIPSSMYWAASLAAAAAALRYFTWFDLTLTDQAYVMTTGVFNLEPTPQVTEMGPSANGLDLPTVNIEQLYALDMARAWLEKPFAARPNNNFKVQLVAKVATGTERIGLLGYLVAKRSYLILRE